MFLSHTRYIQDHNLYVHAVILILLYRNTKEIGRWQEKQEHWQQDLEEEQEKEKVTEQEKQMG